MQDLVFNHALLMGHKLSPLHVKDFANLPVAVKVLVGVLSHSYTMTAFDAPGKQAF